MKILVYGDALFSVEAAQGFSELGHDAEIIHPQTAKELERHIVQTRPDLFMTLGSPLLYSDEMLDIIGRKPSPHTMFIHWDTDGVLWARAELNVIRLSRPDFVFTICPVMLKAVSQLGFPCGLLPFAANPQIHHAAETAQYEGLITFVGNSYPQLARCSPYHLRFQSMEALFVPLIRNDYEIHFYGACTDQYCLKELFGIDIPREWLHGYVPYTEIHNIYSGSFINLIPQNYEHSVIKRAFEILSSGGFGISYETAAMRETFPQGSGIVYTSSQEETLELVRCFQQDAFAYHKVREKALTAAQAHTYKQRLRTMLSLIGQENQLNHL